MNTFGTYYMYVHVKVTPFEKFRNVCESIIMYKQQQICWKVIIISFLINAIYMFISLTNIRC